MTTLQTHTAAAPDAARPESDTGRAPAVDVRDLRLDYTLGTQTTHAVEGVSFTVPAGEAVALVGESGSGKSSVASVIAGLMSTNATVVGGAVELFGRDVSALTPAQWRELRGGTIGFVPQDPLGSLDPLMRIGDQVAEAVSAAGGRTGHRQETRERALELLTTVGIPSPEEKYASYPHQLSGGQLQRVLIAIALAGNPRLLVADEPTSALDVTVQKRILDLIDELRETLGLTVLLITHDLSLAGERADRIVVLRHGELVEQGAASVVLTRPREDYTRTLFADVPALNPARYRDSGVRRGGPARTAVAVDGLVKDFGGSSPAVEDVSFEVQEGTVHALVGESGSGKTTVARIIAGLESSDAGTVRVFGDQLPSHPPTVNPHPDLVQLVYQNPLSALDPRMGIRDLVAAPLEVHGHSRRAARGTAAGLLDRVGIPARLWKRRTSRLSGGQRQRVAVARALALSPRIVVLDEPTSALDVTVQARITDLLFELRADRPELTFLFISHDLGLVRQIADRVTVLNRGTVVETGSVDDVLTRSRRVYTRSLVDAVPQLPGHQNHPDHNERNDA